MDHVAEPVTVRAPGRHRLVSTPGGRLHRVHHLTRRAGSIVSLAALALLGTALAIGLTAHDPTERPTLTVTYDVAP